MSGILPSACLKNGSNPPPLLTIMGEGTVRTPHFHKGSNTPPLLTNLLLAMLPYNYFPQKESNPPIQSSTHLLHGSSLPPPLTAMLSGAVQPMHLQKVSVRHLLGPRPWLGYEQFFFHQCCACHTKAAEPQRQPSTREHFPESVSLSAALATRNEMRRLR